MKVECQNVANQMLYCMLDSVLLQLFVPKNRVHVLLWNENSEKSSEIKGGDYCVPENMILIVRKTAFSHHII